MRNLHFDVNFLRMWHKRNRKTVRMPVLHFINLLVDTKGEIFVWLNILVFTTTALSLSPNQVKLKLNQIKLKFNQGKPLGRYIYMKSMKIV